MAASGLIEGFGLVVAIIGLIMWAGIPLFKLVKYFSVGTKTERPNRLWFASAMTLTLLLAACFFYFCPSPTVVSAPIVIDYEPLHIVRSKSKGFVGDIHVRDGQAVEEGQLLVTLTNPELKHDHKSLLIDIRISKLRFNTFYNQGEISQAQLEERSLESMLKREAELSSRIAELEIYAPSSGSVLARDLDAQTGQYLEPGDEILSIATAGEIHAVALTRQDDIEWVAENPESEIELRIWGRHQRELLKGRVKHINPRARDDLPHEAFSASVGGPLAVVPRSQVEDDDSEENDMMLSQPRVPVEIELEPFDRETLVAGQTGELIVRSRKQNMGGYLAHNLIRFIRENNFRTHGL